MKKLMLGVLLVAGAASGARATVEQANLDAMFDGRAASVGAVAGSSAQGAGNTLGILQGAAGDSPRANLAANVAATDTAVPSTGGAVEGPHKWRGGGGYHHGGYGPRPGFGFALGYMAVEAPAAMLIASGGPSAPLGIFLGIVLFPVAVMAGLATSVFIW